MRSLNPCSNGRYSQSILFRGINFQKEVLILVLMEDTLRAEQVVFDLGKVLSHSLNPCSNGRYSQRKQISIQPY